MLEDEIPVLTVTFATQEVLVFRNAQTGEIAVGAQDKVEQCMYGAVVTRVESELENPTTGGWKVIEVRSAPVTRFSTRRANLTLLLDGTEINAELYVDCPILFSLHLPNGCPAHPTHQVESTLGARAQKLCEHPPLSPPLGNSLVDFIETGHATRNLAHTAACRRGVHYCRDSRVGRTSCKRHESSSHRIGKPGWEAPRREASSHLFWTDPSWCHGVRPLIAYFKVSGQRVTGC